MAATSSGGSKLTRRSYVVGQFLLSLDSPPHDCGYLRSVEGGTMKTTMWKENYGGDPIAGKYTSTPQYDDITFQIGMGMSPYFFTWMEKAFTRDVERRNGHISSADFNLKEVMRREFRDALISEIGVPALDGKGGNQPAYLTVKIAPEQVKVVKGDGKMIKSQWGGEQKYWLVREFEFVIDQLGNDACSRVAKVDAFSIKRQIMSYQCGGDRIPARVAGQIEFPNISITVAEVDVEPWIKWYQKAVVEGKTEDTEYTGHLTFRSANSKAVARIDLEKVGIVSIAPDKAEAANDTIRRAKVELYVESMRFKVENQQAAKSL